MEVLLYTNYLFDYFMPFPCRLQCTKMSKNFSKMLFLSESSPNMHKFKILYHFSLVLLYFY
ncbi:MAG TPA: hypothetical protein DCR31_07685 [Ruminococcaceae bacterium]|nr:hypothetical protein [Oscillospiraceae bacterium]